MKYPAGISGEEYAAMEEGYEQGVAEGRAERARVRAERDALQEQVTQLQGSVRTEWGLMLDCAANGCTELHDDDRDVMFRGGERPVTERVNGHAVRVVARTVTTSDWRDAGEAGR
jgi:hypothetical protein